MRRFIGMTNFYRRFILNCSSILNPLTNLLHGRNKGISLEGDTLHVFHTSKTTLANFTKLSFIENNPQTSICLTTDVPDSGVGAVVEQGLHSQRKPIAFLSSKLSPAQSRYSTFS